MCICHNEQEEDALQDQANLTLITAPVGIKSYFGFYRVGTANLVSRWGFKFGKILEKDGKTLS